jgi:hypothetical protein
MIHGGPSLLTGGTARGARAARAQSEPCLPGRQARAATARDGACSVLHLLVRVSALVLLALGAGIGWLSTACGVPPGFAAARAPGYSRDPSGARGSSQPPAGRLARRDDDLAFCVAETNRYRARHGKPPLRRSAELEAYAATGARYDTGARRAHKHFDDTRGGDLAFAENACLAFHGWSLEFGGGSVRRVLSRCLRTFYAEGPGGGHFENMMGEYRTLGCGVYVAGGGVSIVQDFGR